VALEYPRRIDSGHADASDVVDLRGATRGGSIMRVLVTTPAGLGHVHPMVPRARALARRGHEVRWALPELVADRVVLGALTLGLPQVCLPQGADQFLNAAAVVASGAGLSITPEAASTEAVRDAVASVLGDDSYRHAAQRIAAAITAMPSPDEVAGILEDFVERGG
jgi:UDP:flavonoid glycosyltransferase YjiC (YdhE family)